MEPPPPVSKPEAVLPVQALPEKTIKQAASEEPVAASEPVNNVDTSEADTEKAEAVSYNDTVSPKDAMEKSLDGTDKAGVVQLASPRYQLNSPPLYPGLARKRGQAGTVVLQVLVNRQGRVDDLKVEVSSSFSLLDRAALAAVNKWSFEPGRQNGEAISMWVRVPVTFRLK